MYFRVNRGREPTRLGNDGILPYFDVERFYVGPIAVMLRRLGVRCSVTYCVGVIGGAAGSPAFIDRISVESHNFSVVEACVVDFVSQLPARSSLSMIHYAAIAGDLEQMAAYLLGGGDPNVIEKLRGFTALHYLAENIAAGGPRLHMLNLLVAANVDVTIRSFDGDTAADIGEREDATNELVRMLRSLEAAQGEA